MTKMIKKAQTGVKVKDTTKTYQSNPGFQALMNKKKLNNKKSVSTKMKNGGSLSGLTASNKRDKGIDPDGPWTKVQKKAIAGAKGKASLTKDKQLGATKMAKRGISMKKK
jgi:hypothetical protein